jgi:hypothetical protein
MRYLSLKAFALSAACLLPFGVAQAATLDDITFEARQAKAKADEMRTMLKNRAVDPSRVSAQMEVLEAHSAKLNELITAYAEANQTLDRRAASELERMKVTAEVLQILFNNKQNLMESNGMSNRGLLRAKAEGIARRAGMIQQSAQRIRG